MRLLLFFAASAAFAAAAAATSSAVQEEDIADGNLMEEYEQVDVPIQRDVLRPIRTGWKIEPVIDLDHPGRDGPQLLASLLPKEDGEELDGAADLAILFLSGDSPSQTHMLQTFQQVARSYWGDLERKKSVSTSKLFFFQANASKSTKLFREYQILKAPTLVFVRRSEALPAHAFSIIYDASAYAESVSLAQWLSEQSNVPLAVLTTASDTTTTSNAMTNFFTSESVEKIGRLVLFIQLAAIAYANAHRFARKEAWFLLSLAIYFISVSGLIFSLLRGMPPFAYMPKQGGFYFFYPGQQNQFVFEGLLAGGLQVAVSALLTCTAFYRDGIDVVDTLEKEMNRDGATTATGRWSRITRHRLRDNGSEFDSMLKTANICLSSALLLYVLLHLIFQRKASWYQPFT